jgi:hypothetical protein
MNRIGIFVLLILASLLIGCSNAGNTGNNAVAANIPAITVNWKKDVTPDDIARIKWLEGTWRGTAEGQEPFYERYHFDGTTLSEESFADADLKTVKDTAKYVLINGEFRHTQNAKRVAASEITDDHIQFVPVVGGGNSYRFEKQPGGKWRAIIDWPATDGQPAKQVIYNMEPYDPKKK